MNRRNFLSTSLSTSLAASALSLAADTKAAAEYYDLRRYQLASGPGTKLTDDYFGGALIPALNRLGIGPVGGGVFRLLRTRYAKLTIYCCHRPGWKRW